MKSYRRGNVLSERKDTGAGMELRFVFPRGWCIHRTLIAPQ